MCQSILFYYSYYAFFANILVSSTFLKMVNIHENYEIICSECPFMELTNILILKEAVWILNSFFISTVFVM